MTWSPTGSPCTWWTGRATAGLRITRTCWGRALAVLLEAGAAFFTPPDHERHTQWPGERGAEDPEFAQLAASFGFLMADLAEAQELDGRRLAALLDLTGPAILITHSAGAPGGWLAANQRPDLVVGIIAVEPMGPPFAELPGPGEMTWGLSYGKPVTAPPTDDPSELKADPGRFAIPGLTDHPILVVAGDVSISAAGARPTVEFLDAVGANAELLDLPEVGIHGNSHGLVFERNSRQISALLVDWIQRLEAT